jgi:uncharacterized protein YyaL (SSP411 family)
VLPDWNGLMIAALAKAGKVLEEAKFVDVAKKTANFFLTQMRNSEGSLYHRYAGGERAVEGFLDDYTALVFGLLELYEATFDKQYLNSAVELTQKMNTLFWDDQNGGYYFTAAKPASGMPRMKQIYDGASPSGNSLALLNLLRLSVLADEPVFEEMARKLVKAFSLEVQSAPEAYTWLLAGVNFMVGPSQSIVLVGDPEGKDTEEMLRALREQYLPNMMVQLREPADTGVGYEQLEGKATAYVCLNQTCMPPTNQTQKMLELLGAK